MKEDMANSLIRIWKNKDKIFEGIKNSIFTKQHIEEIADLRMDICKVCPHIDTRGSYCAMPKTQPCCKLCGCNLHLKTRSLSSSCDDNRWYAELTQQEEDALVEKLKDKPNDTNLHAGETRV